MPRRAGEVSTKRWYAQPDDTGYGWIIFPQGGGLNIAKVTFESDAAHIVDFHNRWLEVQPQDQREEGA